MKNLFYATCLTIILALVVLLPGVVAARPDTGCAKIQSGTITDTAGNPIMLGYDKYGYNYQAHMFNGLYDNFSRPTTPFTTGNVNLIMKWSDNWLSSQDCTNDGKLDRDGATNVSKGWLTNHMEGDCLLGDGSSIHVTYFVKIVYVGAVPDPPAVDTWADQRIWGVYAIIEEVGEDPTNGVCLGTKGLVRSSLANPAGFGAYQ